MGAEDEYEKGQSKYEHDDDASVGRWGFKYGTRAPRVTVLERPDRGPAQQPTLVARWYVNGREQGPYTMRRVDTVRGKGGDIDMEKRHAAEQEAKRIWKEVQNGTPPEEIFAEPEEEEEEGEERTPKDELTLGEGLDLFMDEEEGRYAGETDDEWYDDQLRRAERLEDVLGRDTKWVHLVPAKVKALWVKLHDYYEDTEHTGRRESIRTVQLLGSARKWLVANGRLTQEAPELPQGWRNSLKNYWQKHADEEITVSRPLHSEDELRLIAAAVRDPEYDIDPRFRALMTMGLGQRLGPVGTRALRSNLRLDDSGRWGLGQLVIPSRPGKQGVRIDLSRGLREMWEHLLEDGYLEHLEADYQAGDLEDYHLLPGGKFVQGKARADKGDEPIQDRWMNTQLRKLEAEIYRRNQDLDLWTREQRQNETMHVHGRGWHGLRRGMVELLDEKGVQPSVRNAMMGWVPGSRVPELIYQNRNSEQRYRRAAETREEVTEVLGMRVPGEGDDGRTRDAIRADIDEAIDDDDKERVRELMDELDALAGDG